MLLCVVSTLTKELLYLPYLRDCHVANNTVCVRRHMKFTRSAAIVPSVHAIMHKFTGSPNNKCTYLAVVISYFCLVDRNRTHMMMLTGFELLSR
jgi:hypothetical protein